MNAHDRYVSRRFRLVEVEQFPSGLWAVLEARNAVAFFDTEEHAMEAAETLLADLRYEEERS